MSIRKKEKPNKQEEIHTIALKSYAATLGAMSATDNIDSLRKNALIYLSVTCQFDQSAKDCTRKTTKDLKMSEQIGRATKWRRNAYICRQCHQIMWRSFASRLCLLQFLRSMFVFVRLWIKNQKIKSKKIHWHVWSSTVGRDHCWRWPLIRCWQASCVVSHRRLVPHLHHKSPFQPKNC